jgi:hypothetical protein
MAPAFNSPELSNALEGREERKGEVVIRIMKL